MSSRLDTAHMDEQNIEKARRACLSNDLSKQIYIPDALKNVSGTSRPEVWTSVFWRKENGCGPSEPYFSVPSIEF